MSRTMSMYMIKNPVAVSLTANMDEVLGEMKDSRLSHVLVNDQGGNLVGVISKADILSKMKSLLDTSSGATYAALERKSILAKDMMASELMTVKPDDSLDYGVELLLQKEFHCLPVVEEGKAIGILTFYDLLKGYYQQYG